MLLWAQCQILPSLGCLGGFFPLQSRWELGVFYKHILVTNARVCVVYSDLFLGGPWINPIFIKQHYLACPLQRRPSLTRAQRMFEPRTEWRLHCLWIWVTIIVHVCLIAPVSGWHAKPVLMHAYTFLYMLNLVFTISAIDLLNKDNKAKLLSTLLRQRSAARGTVWDARQLCLP